MKKQQRSSVDGFIPRRPDSRVGELHDKKNPEGAIKPIDRTLHTGDNDSTDFVGVPRKGKEFGHDDLFQTLQDINETEVSETRRERHRRRKEEKRQKQHRSKGLVGRIVKWTLIVIGILVLVGGGYLAYKAINAGTSVFSGNLIDVFTKNDPLKQDSNGRSNFLIFGTAEDDEGGTHDGPFLTDSIMVLSVDQEKKNAYMLSLPRDLWVEYAEPCSAGYQGKINATFACGSNGGEDEKAGAKALSDKVGEVVGLDMHYYVHLNFTAVVDAVDAVGGVDVTIDSPDPRGILDRNFDWKCQYRCYYVNYKNGENVHLDGEHALALARARNAAGGYGLPNGNFDREKNQQKVIKALREKALSAGTLTNLGAVTGLVDALGNNLRTNIETKEIRTLMDVATKINSDNIISLSLNEEGESLVTTGMYGPQSIVRPILGLLDYSAIQDYVKKNMASDPFVREDPHVSVYNGSEVAGIAQTEANILTDLGFTIDTVENAPEGNYGAVEVYQIANNKPATAEKLKSYYKVEIKTTKPPVSVVGETDFVVILGREPART